MAPSSNRPGRSPFKAEMLSSNLTGVILAPSTNRNRWPPPQGGDTGSSPVGVIRWLLRSSVIITGGSSRDIAFYKNKSCLEF